MTTRPDSFSEAKELSRLDDLAFRNRCIKLKWRNAYQNNVFALAFALLIITFFFLMEGYVGLAGRRQPQSPPVPALIPVGFTTLGISLVLCMSAMAVQNYSLVDPIKHRLYRCFRFLWWRKRQILFLDSPILAVTTDIESRATRGGIFWYYRLVAVGKDGRKEPLSNWRHNGLDRWNAKAQELGPKLGCASYGAPPKSMISVEEENGIATLKFAPWSRS
jgi:hypothetical protein